MKVKENCIRYVIDWVVVNNYKATPNQLLRQLKPHLTHPYGKGIKCMFDFYKAVGVDFNEDCDRLGIEKISIHQNVFVNRETYNKLEESLMSKYKTRDGQRYNTISLDVAKYGPSIDDDIENDIIEIRVSKD